MADKDDVKLVASDFNLQTIGTEEYAETLAGAIQAGTNLAVFGRRGSGKTEIAKQVVASTELPDGSRAREVYVNLSVVERTDVGGYPDMFGMLEKNSTSDKRERFINFILPMFFKHLIVGNQPVALILDEVDKADPSIHAPLLEILQFKSINGMALPNLRTSILTGNLISEGSARPSLPLLDRTEKYLLQADATSFLAWAARSNKIHPSISQFLNDKNSCLYGTNDGSGDLYAEPSPRGWENASKILNFGEANKWSKELMLRKVKGFVGKNAGLQYEIYFEHYRELLPMIDRIFAGEDVTHEYRAQDPSKQIYAAMIACSRLCGYLDKVPMNEDGKPESKPKELAYIGKFLHKAVSDENILFSVRTQITLNRVVLWDLDSNKDWGNILNNITNSVDRA